MGRTTVTAPRCLSNRAGLRSALVLIAICGCRTPPPPPPPPPAPPPTAYVHPKGDDRDDGSEAAPFRTVARALSARKARIRVHAGTYPVGRLFITQPVDLASTSTGAVLKGAIFVTADDTRIEGFRIEGGLDGAQSDRFLVKNVEIEPVDREDALTIVGSTATLESLRLQCGEETCLHVTTSTVTLNDADMTGASNTLRALRVSSARMQAERLRVRGTRAAQVQVELQSTLILSHADLAEARGSAIVAIRQSRIDLDQVKTASIAMTAVLAQTSSVTAADSAFGPTGGQTISISGGFVRLTQCRVAAGEAAANLRAFDGTPGQLHIVDSVVAHGDRDGVLGSASLVQITGSRFEGRPGPGGGHALSVRGAGARATIKSSHFIAPAGLGLELVEGAAGTMTGTITAPGLGGLHVSGALGTTVVLDGLTVENCVSGPAIHVLDSNDVRIARSRLEGCIGGGIIAGSRSNLRIDDAIIRTGGQYGLAAFGGTRAVVRSSTVTGTPWAIFSACADSSLIVDAGRNHFVGGRGECL